jgi:formylglycine-generating enzyme required for sulfatase activity
MPSGQNFRNKVVWCKGDRRARLLAYKDGTKTPHVFGLDCMVLDVWEWVEDKWHSNYTGAPQDGSAWIAGGEPERVLRGGYSDSPLWCVPCAYRRSNSPDFAHKKFGLRLVRQ